MNKLYTTSDLNLAKYLTNSKFHEIVWIEYKKKWPQDEDNDEIKVYLSYEETPELLADIKRFNIGDVTIHLTDEQWRNLAIPYRYPTDNEQEK